MMWSDVMNKVRNLLLVKFIGLHTCNLSLQQLEGRNRELFFSLLFLFLKGNYTSLHFLLRREVK